MNSTLQQNEFKALSGWDLMNTLTWLVFHTFQDTGTIISPRSNQNLGEKGKDNN